MATEHQSAAPVPEPAVPAGPAPVAAGPALGFPGAQRLGGFDEEKQVGDAIVAATDGYCAGFMAGLGWGGSGGDPKWFADGQQKGAAAKASFVARVKADPKLQSLDIGPDEVMLAMADQKEAFHRELYARVKPKVADAYIAKWKAGLGWASKTFTNEETSGERNIRTRAGMPAQ